MGSVSASHPVSCHITPQGCDRLLYIKIINCDSGLQWKECVYRKGVFKILDIFS